MTALMRFVLMPDEPVEKARRKWPKGAPGGRGGQWMPANAGGSGVPTAGTKTLEVTGTDRKAVREVQTAFNALPESHRKFSRLRGIKVERLQHKRFNPQTGREEVVYEYDGLYEASSVSTSGSITVSPRALPGGMTHAEVLLHEFGHHVDHRLGRVSEKLPLDQMMSLDTRTLPEADAPDILRRADYITQPREMFANSYAILMKGRTLDPNFSTQEFRKYFPRTLRMVRDILLQAGLEVPE